MEAIKWNGDAITVLNAQLLPDKSYYHNYKNFREVGAAVEAKLIPGTVSRALAVVMSSALTAEQSLDFKPEQFKEHLDFVVDYFDKITAMNPLTRSILARLRTILAEGGSVQDIAKKFKDESSAVLSELQKSCEAISANLASTFEPDESVMIFSAAGSSLAAPGGGLITAALREASKKGKKVRVYCCETRPDFSGSRIMAYDLKKNGLDTVVIPDIQAYYLMQKKLVSRVILVADAMCENDNFRAHCGSVMIAASARELHVPVDLVAPGFLIDRRDCSLDDQDNRASINEVAIVNNGVVAPEGITINNFLSDLTPYSDISRFVTEKGLFTEWKQVFDTFKVI
ncbi:MAG: hypothetical protein PF637_13210 [Spirochaetes bacterium]|jgi:methylthioribose-1-phosphate isomerase|nr:hypothetical protein [Spirochaetota bacterium]